MSTSINSLASVFLFATILITQGCQQNPTNEFIKTDNTLSSLSIEGQEVVANSTSELKTFVEEVKSAVANSLIALNTGQDFPQYAEYTLEYKVEDIENSELEVKAVLKVQNSLLKKYSRTFTIKDLLYFNGDSLSIQNKTNSPFQLKLQADIVSHIGNSWLGHKKAHSQEVTKVISIPKKTETHYEAFFTLERKAGTGLEITFLSVFEVNANFSKQKNTIHHILIRFYTDEDLDKANTERKNNHVTVSS